MKVGTDGILLGAWTSLPEALDQPMRLLDIGTGTGLLALMLAQRLSKLGAKQFRIDAVEIDEQAYTQALENIQRSPWRDSIHVHHASIQDFVQKSINLSPVYDLVISNPPFFENAYKSIQKARSLARHSDHLSQDDLLQVASQVLKPNAHLAVIYPTELAHNFVLKAKDYQLSCDRQLLVQPMPNREVKRVLLQLRNQEIDSSKILLTNSQLMIIEESKHKYTEEYIALTQDFYLKRPSLSRGRAFL